MAEKADKITTQWLNWVAKQVSIKDKKANYKFTASLGTPGVLLETDDANLSLEYDKEIKYLAFVSGNGIEVRPASALKDSLIGNKMTANWILLWTGKAIEAPCLLVLEKKPAQLNVVRNVFSVTGREKVGKVLITLPFGLKGFKSQELEGWNRGLPGEVAEQCKFWSKALLEYPVQCHEYYSLDDSRSQVTIREQWDYLTIKDEWNTESVKVAVMPPLASFARTQEYFQDRMTVDKGLQDMKYPTWYGRLEGKTGTDSVSFTLPVPPLDAMVSLPTDECPFVKKIADYRLNYGRNLTIRNTQIPKAPQERNYKRIPIYLADLSIGLWADKGTMEKLLAEEKKLIERFLGNEFADLFPYIEDPVSKKGFYVSADAVADAPSRPSGKRVYDSDAFAAGIIGGIKDYIVWSSDYEMLADKYEKIRKIFSTFDLLNEWALMSSMSSDGGGPQMNAVDCSWDVWPALDGMAKLAQLMNDRRTYEYTQYLRARQWPVTVLKIALQRDYLAKYFPFKENEYVVGLGEPDGNYAFSTHFASPPVAKSGPADAGRSLYGFPWLFNTATCSVWPAAALEYAAIAAPKSLSWYVAMVEKQCPGAGDATKYRLERSKVDEKECFTMSPELSQLSATISRNHAILKILCGAAGQEQLQNLMATVTCGTFQSQQPFWIFGGYGGTWNLSCALPLAEGVIRTGLLLQDWGDWQIEEGGYSSKTKEATIKLRNLRNSSLSLRLWSRFKPLSASINSKALCEVGPNAFSKGWYFKEGSGELLVKAGTIQEIELKLSFADAPPAFPCLFLSRESGAQDGNLLHDPGFEIEKELSSFEVSGTEMRDVILHRWNTFGFYSAGGIFGYDRSVVSTSTNAARSGKSSAKLVLDKEAVFFQDVASVTGAVYTATFYYQAPELDPAMENLKFMIVAGSVAYHEKVVGQESVSVSKATGPGEWGKAEVRMRCPEGANIISPHVRYQPKVEGAAVGRKMVYIDDISFKIERIIRK